MNKAIVFWGILFGICIAGSTANAGNLRKDSTLINYYSFDSISGATVFDGSKHGIDGTMTDVVVKKGKVGNCAEFNNRSSHVLSGSIPRVENFSAMAWIKPYSYGKVITDNNILVFEKSESYYMNIMSNSTGNRLMGKIRVGGQFQSVDGKTSRWEYLDSPDTIKLNQWTHVAYTFDGNKFVLYVNGAMVSEKVILPVLKQNNYSMVWGAVQKVAAGNFLGHFDGCLDECMVFSRKLEGAEIKAYFDDVMALEGGIPEGMTEIFNKVDLTGWTQKGNPSATWAIVDGMLKPYQPNGSAGWIQYQKKYTDFSFYCEWKTEVGGNNGVQINIPDVCAEPVYEAIEFQIADDDNYSLFYKKSGFVNGDIRELSGAIYGIVGASKRMFKGVNQWNSYLITCVGDSIKLLYNNALVLNINRNDYNKSFEMWNGMRSALSVRPRTGYIALQSHKGGTVYLRNIAVKEIESTVSVPEKRATGIGSVYPNPTSRLLNLDIPGLQSCRVYDTRGNELINQNHNLVDLEGFAPGVYFVRAILNEEESRWIKISKILPNDKIRPPMVSHWVQPETKKLACNTCFLAEPAVRVVGVLRGFSLKR